MTEVMKDIKINKKKMKDSANLNYSTATDFADWLVINLGYTFREAHNIAGKAVALAEKKKCLLNELKLEEFERFDSKITQDVYNFLDPYNSVANKKSKGGTSFREIKKSIKNAKIRMKKK